MSHFPQASIVWNGAILGTVVKAVATASNPAYDWTQYWSGDVYLVQGGDGRNGAIAFRGPQGDSFVAESSLLIGLFYSTKSGRCPQSDDEARDVLQFVLRGCPSEHRRLAENEALQYMLYELFPGGPTATTAFWNVGAVLTAAEQWDDVGANGANLIRIEMIENISEAILEWQSDYGLTDDQIALASSIYTRRLSDPFQDLQLTKSEGAYLRSLSVDPVAFETCRRSFADIHVVVP